MENENEDLNKRLEDTRRREIDLQSHNEQLEFDLDMMRRNVNSNNQSRDVLNKKEEELMRELNHV